MPATYEALSQGGHEAMATEIFTKIKAYLDTHGADSKVSKAGDTMTGELLIKQSNSNPFQIDLDELQPTGGQNIDLLEVQYKNTDGDLTHTVYPIAILGNDDTTTNYNSGVRLGSTNGTTIIGAGESSRTFSSAQGFYNDENLYCITDGEIHFYTGLSNDSTTIGSHSYFNNAGLHIGNTTIYSAGSNGGINSAIFGDDVTIGDCNVSGMLGMKGTGNNAGIRLYKSTGALIGGFQSTNGTAQWINSSSTAYNIWHTGNLSGLYSRSSTGTLDWGTNNTHVIQKSALAYWNGCYSGTASNLQYCNRGRFGTIVTKGSGDYIATTGGNITGTNRFKFNNNQEIYQNEGYLILGTSNMVCVRTYNNINAAKPIQAASFQTYSSRLIKKNITDITQDEAKSLLNLRVVDFDYIEQVGGQTNQTGIIAEEALSVYPKCVDIPENYDEDEVKKAIETGGAINAINVDYTKLIAPLIKLVQMQQKEIDEIRKEKNYETTR